MARTPETPGQLSFGSLVREYILPYNTLFAISGVVAFVLGLVSPALVLVFGALLLSANALLLLANLRREKLVAWATEGEDGGGKRVIRFVWPSRDSRLRTSGIFWVFLVTGAAVTLYGSTGAFDRAKAAGASREISALAEKGPQAGAPRILVLPFGMQGAPDGQSAATLGVGIHDDIIAGLSRFSSVQVLGRNTASAVSPLGGDHAAIRDKFSVKYLVSGRLRIAAEQVRLDLELAETGTGTTVWSESIVKSLSEVMNLGDEAVRLIVGRIAAQVMHAEVRTSRASRETTASAYVLTLQGRSLWRRPGRETLPQAQAVLRKAIEIDPTYAPAHVFLAFTYLTSYNNSWSDGFSRPETLAEMLRLASAAIELEPQEANAHAAQAIAFAYLGRHDEALEASRRSLRLNGSEPENLARVGQVLSFSGEHRSAVRVLQTANELDPLGPAQLLNFLSRAYFMAGDHPMAITHARRCNERATIDPCAETLAAAYALSGQREEAAAAWRDIVKKRGDADPAKMVARLQKAFRNPEDLKRLTDGLRTARQEAASPAR
jgi:adenylate cyclase